MRKIVIATLAALSMGALSVLAAGAVVKPTIIEKVQPTYPTQCQQTGVEGRVIVECLITSQGEVRGATAVKSPSSELGDAAVLAVSQWKFAPATRDGVPTEAVVRIPVEFKLEMDESGTSVPSIIARN